MIPEAYDEIWTAARGMYKLEAAVTDGGEVTICAPHITEFNHTHGEELAEVGYHVRDYLTRQWERLQPVLAHSTHPKSPGTCLQRNVGCWDGRESEGILLVPKAGEVLYRLWA